MSTQVQPIATDASQQGSTKAAMSAVAVHDGRPRRAVKPLLCTIGVVALLFPAASGQRETSAEKPLLSAEQIEV
jgi:hypothetical protein